LENYFSGYSIKSIDTRIEETLPVSMDYPCANRSDNNAIPVQEVSHLEGA
jgi:hypothetical protein